MAGEGVGSAGPECLPNSQNHRSGPEVARSVVMLAGITRVVAGVHD